MFNNNFDFKICHTNTDLQGNYLIIKIKTSQQELILANVYGPNRDTPEFYQNIKDILASYQNQNIIIGGDWNLVLDTEKDYKNYLHVNNPNARNVVIDMIDDLNLIDVWREMNPETLRYTWHRHNPSQHSRLDYFLVAENLLTYVKNTEIPIGYRSDHSMVSLELQFTKESKFRNFWKFNSSLLKDQEFVNEINNVITKIKQQYAIPVYNTEKLDSIPLDEIEFVISNQLFLDTLFMEIRSKSMEYGAKKKRKDNEQEKELEKEITKLTNKTNLTPEETTTLILYQDQLKDIRKNKIEAIILRSKATYACQGEKISKYYCNMEKKTFFE